MANKKTSTEKTLEKWKEYGGQFSEAEKKSYVNGYNHAIQDILRLAYGGAKARLVRSYALRDVLRAVVEASVQCGIDAARSRVQGCEYGCECYSSDIGCAASGVYYPHAESCCSVKSGIPSFEEFLEGIQSERRQNKSLTRHD